MPNKKIVLVIDDNADIRLSARFLLTNHGFEVKEADSPMQGIELLKSEPVDLVMLDMNFSRDTSSGEEGLYCLRKIKELDQSLPVVVVTGWAAVELVVSTLKIGAEDFIEKPWDNQRLLQVIRQALKLGRLEKQNIKLQQYVREQEKPIQLVAHSATMKALKSKLDDIACTDVTLLLTGENGTGKSTLAQYVHHLYHQYHALQSFNERNTHYVEVNMGAISEHLFESEMFGHVKGAFTGADQPRVGRFELAEHGTLFLDEIANIAPASQAKLLRVLESGHYERVGSSITARANVRLISATNASFERLISQGQFRQDLYFRLNTVELQVPALRNRSEDIPELADMMIVKHCQRYNKPLVKLLPCALERLANYDFPGNLRELSHILERVVLFSTDATISMEQLVVKGLLPESSARENKTISVLPLMTIEQAERQLIEQALLSSQGQTIEAALLLGLSKSALYRRLEKYSITPKEYS
ncbi:MAG: sigma-54 dependent transcriptional regulator [Gammaproteobacteria bacterium]|nr:sigma-54 dependent transcriptional regulator [Gammaproteobacteria bacterium]MBU2058201.1 sigma-54 dependent transcriptional regulator [Gammaproteobacteria bacterium]MBU2176968.1 sigma-54 dependent transcriptional regulator [Gammaproteobacteria bacterium]MBU2246581.1 sigma-54 dependent transcriptional regulator [Gammaproteobacteria bacterium]MBU2344958.1 sigma-54 dependent transcriptional regulator [Gammaproteobacteria bacterium]